MKTSELTIADNIAGDDLLQIVDVNDPTMNVLTGTNKRITATLASNELFDFVEANSVVGNQLKIWKTGFEQRQLLASQLIGEQTHDRNCGKTFFNGTLRNPVGQ